MSQPFGMFKNKFISLTSLMSPFVLLLTEASVVVVGWAGGRPGTVAKMEERRSSLFMAIFKCRPPLGRNGVGTQVLRRRARGRPSCAWFQGRGIPLVRFVRELVMRAGLGRQANTHETKTAFERLCSRRPTRAVDWESLTLTRVLRLRRKQVGGKWKPPVHQV